MSVVTTQAQADALNASGEFGPYYAANGHTMLAALRWPVVHGEGDEGTRSERDYRIGDEIRYDSWSAWCDNSCYACREGDTLPDW